jgi:hypothetical protein
MNRREKTNSRECFFETSFKAMGCKKRVQGSGSREQEQFAVYG